MADTLYLNGYDRTAPDNFVNDYSTDLRTIVDCLPSPFNSDSPVRPDKSTKKIHMKKARQVRTGRKSQSSNTNTQTLSPAYSSVTQQTEALADKMQFHNIFDIDDEKSWKQVCKEELRGRFQQYRELSQAVIRKLRMEPKKVNESAQHKMKTLESEVRKIRLQHSEERKILVHMVDEAIAQRAEAQLLAERGVKHMESFIKRPETDLKEKWMSDKIDMLERKVDVMESQKSFLAHQMETNENIDIFLHQCDESSHVAEKEPLPEKITHDSNLHQTESESASNELTAAFSRIHTEVMEFNSNFSTQIKSRNIPENALRLMDSEPYENETNPNEPDYIESLKKDIEKVLRKTFTFIKHIFNENRLTNNELVSYVENNQIREQLEALKEKYALLENDLTASKKQQEEQKTSSAEMISQMQSSITEMKREIVILKSRTIDHNDSKPLLQFSRSDLERNERILKTALDTGKLDLTKYNTALGLMREYTGIATARLQHLVHKYANQQVVQDVVEYARAQTVFHPEKMKLYDRLEGITQRRSGVYKDRALQLSRHRYEVAENLILTFEEIEQESSIMLVRPTFSATTRKELSAYCQELHDKKKSEKIYDTNENENEIIGKHIKSPPVPESVWVPDDAVSVLRQKTVIEDPKLQELEVNRLLFDQNKISQRAQSDHAYHNSSVRSYISVARPSAFSTGAATRSFVSCAVPPCTPLDVRPYTTESRRVIRDLSGQTRLPPIAPTPRGKQTHRSSERMGSVTTIGSLENENAVGSGENDKTTPYDNEETEDSLAFENYRTGEKNKKTTARNSEEQEEYIEAAVVSLHMITDQ